jgi:hypothetical protein
LLNQNSRLPEQHSLLRGAAEQVIAPKRETAAFLKTLRVKFYLAFGGFALGELHRHMLCGKNERENSIHFKIMRKLYGQSRLLFGKI